MTAEKPQDPSPEEKHGRFFRKRFTRFQGSILGVPPVDEEENPTIIGKDIEYRKFAKGLTFGELCLAVTITLGAATALYLWDTKPWISILAFVALLGLIVVAFTQYKQRKLLQAGLVLSIGPLTGLIIFFIRKDYIWIVVYIVIAAIGLVGSRVIATEEKAMDETAEKADQKAQKKNGNT